MKPTFEKINENTIKKVEQTEELIDIDKIIETRNAAVVELNTINSERLATIKRLDDIIAEAQKVGISPSVELEAVVEIIK